MTKEEIIQYFKEGSFEDVSREEVLYYLFQQGEVLLSDYLELQQMLEDMMKPTLTFNCEVPWDANAWLEYSKGGVIELVPSDATK